MPGARWFEGAELNYAEHIFRGKADDEVAVVYASELRELDRAPLGRAARAGRRPCARACGPSASRGRPRRRLPAERPRGPDRLPRRRQPGRDLVELLARLRAGQRRRPLRPDRAEGAVRGRRLPLRRQGLRPARRRRRGRRADPQPRAHRRRPLPERLARALRPGGPAEGRGADDLGAAARPRLGRRAPLRAGPVRPPALGPLLVGHHRTAQGDRPGARRHPARAPQEGLPPPRRRRPATASSGSRRPAG